MPNIYLELIRYISQFAYHMFLDKDQVIEEKIWGSIGALLSGDFEVALRKLANFDPWWSLSERRMHAKVGSEELMVF